MIAEYMANILSVLRYSMRYSTD